MHKTNTHNMSVSIDHINPPNKPFLFCWGRTMEAPFEASLRARHVPPPHLRYRALGPHWLDGFHGKCHQWIARWPGVLPVKLMPTEFSEVETLLRENHRNSICHGETWETNED